MLGAYPIGSIYLSVNNTSPASLFGGTWEKIQDRFLLASGSSYSLGATGGEKEHTLTINEMPSHSHNVEVMVLNNITNTPQYGPYFEGRTAYSWSSQGNAYGMNNTGGSKAHNNMPPYLVVNVWKRIS